MDNRKTAAMFKAFCDENRLQILKLLRRGECCACVLLEDLNITQPTLSHHMKILMDAGVVVGRKEGKWMHYSISPDGMEKVIGIILSLTSAHAEENEQPCCEK